MYLKTYYKIYIMEEPQKVIKSETIKRLLKDVKQIIKHPLTDNGIYYSHNEEDVTKGYAMIVGPENTPYFGGYYFFKFDFPIDYPFSPPKVKYMTNDGQTRFNPNLYKCGKVCVSILNTWSGDKWSACQTITTVLLTLCTLLNEYPLENEPGQSKHCRDFLPYQKSIEYKNIEFAICKLLSDKNKIPKPFDIFYPFMVEHFNRNYDKLMEFVKSKPSEVNLLRVNLYGMSTNINYPFLEKKLIEIKELVSEKA